MDGTIRDLAALRSTYKLIDKTDTAIMLIGSFWEKSKIEKVMQPLTKLFEKYEDTYDETSYYIDVFVWVDINYC